ncbi:unnamed protein product [Ceratitis capitata]|uniref:(Mediterranean fruit fly) hypothetical protein n=1 Tax=Ceratitis capitata TaxID=7213 RepID=A0A811UZ05_CERCA|nr:unnamed protein product [Ceratitis capitata]
MAFRGNQNRNRNFGGNNYGSGPMGGANRMGNMNMSPWDTPNAGGNFGGGNMRQGGGGQGMNAQAINLANNLLNNLFRNQNPPSLLDLPRGGGGGMGNRNQRGGPMVNRGGVPGNRMNNRRAQGGFQNRGGAGKSAQKQGAGGIRKQNAFDRAKKLLAKNANNNKRRIPLLAIRKLRARSHPMPACPTTCSIVICGRTHLMMREGIEESYRLKANMIRQEAKIAEQLKSIELDRLKRMGKTKQRQLEYCTMCDLNFHGHISAHRKSEGHLSLKKFLHPKCIECNKEFATRIDYDTHLLSADHLQKAAEKNTKVGERKRNTLTIHTEEEESKDLRPPQKKRKKPAAKKAEGETTEVKKEGEEGAEGEEAEGEDAEKKEGEEGADETKEGEDLNETQEEEEVALPVDPEDCIIDFSDGDEIPTEVDTRLPKYNWTRPVGAGLITKLECYECSLCGKFFDTEKTVERAAAALEESERKKRKLEEAEAAATEIKTENGEAAEGGEGELYDPSEATGDDEDVEMNENGEGAEGAEGDEGEEEVLGDEEMEAQEQEQEQEVEEEAEPEPEPEPEPVKEQPKPEPVKTTPAAKPAPATPVATTPAPAVVDNSPAKKATPARATPKATPRGRGRGRYNRY